MDRKPIVISVSGKGNRFACDACYKNIREVRPVKKQSCRMTRRSGKYIKRPESIGE